MPLQERLPIGVGCTQWEVWGTVARIVVTDPDRLDAAAETVRAELAAVDLACSRFRTDAEIHDVARAAGRPVRVSTRARRTRPDRTRRGRRYRRRCRPDTRNGDERDSATTATSTPSPRRGARTAEDLPAPAGWRGIHLDGRELTVPAGVRLDLGATAKAYAADRAAALVAQHCGTGVLVSLGGDIATAGPHRPAGGCWSRTGRAIRPARSRLPAGAGAGHLQHGQPALAHRPAQRAPHPRPAHRPAGPDPSGAPLPWPPSTCVRRTPCQHRRPGPRRPRGPAGCAGPRPAGPARRRRRPRRHRPLERGLDGGRHDRRAVVPGPRHRRRRRWSC